MTPDQILAAARQLVAAHRATPYRMGGDDWQTGMDCSAFIWRVVGQRKLAAGVWRNTDWLVRNRHQPPMRELAAGESVAPGSIAVYGGRVVRGRRYAGHVGIVVDADRQIVIDCSSSAKGIRERVAPILFLGPSDGRPVFFLRFEA